MTEKLIRIVMGFDDLPDRIKSKIDRAADGCWLWTAGRGGRGYGTVNWEGKPKPAHRLVYELLVKSIEAETLDHLCRVRNCVNPEHLEEVSHRTNILRGQGATARNAAKTHCPKGHPLVPGNLRPSDLKKGKRRCRECDNERIRLKRGSE